MTTTGLLRTALLGGAIIALPFTLSGCGNDLESHTSVQDCNGNRYIAPSNSLVSNNGHGPCVLRNGVMPQPQEFD